MTTLLSDRCPGTSRPIGAARPFHYPTASLNDLFANIRNIPSKSLQGRSPKQGAFILLLAIAHEIHGIFYGEVLFRYYISLSARSAVCQSLDGRRTARSAVVQRQRSVSR